MWKQGIVSRVPWRLLACGGWRWANYNQGILGDWLGVHIWIPLVVLKLQVGQKLGKLAVIDQVENILSKLLQSYGLASWADCCKGHGFCFIYGLAIVCLYIQSLKLDTLGFCGFSWCYPSLHFFFSIHLLGMWACSLSPLHWWLMSPPFLSFSFFLSTEEPLLCSKYSITPQLDNE